MLREKQAEEQKKKLEELREAQRRAQDIREKQLQERQRKILEQRRREEEHRALVEERRRRMEQEENEKRVALLKKNAERESKLEAARQKLLTVGPAPDKRLSLSTGQLSPARGKLLGRHSMGTAGSTSNLRITSLSSTNLATSKPSPKKTRLSGSSSNLGPATIPGESRMKPAASTTSLMPKNRSKSADVSTMRISRSSQDIKKSIDRLSMPRGPREPRDRSMPNRPAPKVPAAPPVKLQPAVPRALPRETNKTPTPKDKNKQPTLQKGPVKAIHNVNVSTAKKPNKPAAQQNRSSPSPKMGSPAKEKATPGTSPSVSPPPASSPVPGEEKKDEEKKVDKAEEYKAKMAAKRKEMREKAEKEAEEKRLREEEERRLEEERIRREEEEERQRIVEEERQAAEARKAEEERLRQAIEKAERERREEEERVEEERKTREEAEKLAKEEAERKEIERLEKLRKEEEERQERRKRLEMIMNRVRPDQADKSDSPSPTKSVSPPSATTPEREIPSNVMTASGSFKSPLLQQMMSKKAQAETGQEQAAEFAESAPGDESPVQAEPEIEAAVASETPEAVQDVAEVPEEQAIEQPSEATTDVVEVEETAPVEAPAEETVAEAEVDTVPETKPEPEEEKVEAAEKEEENVAQEVVTSVIEEAVAEAGQPVTNGDVESHEPPHSDNSSPAKGSPAHSPRGSNNTSTSVSLDVSPNSSAPASPKREGASSADEGPAVSDEDKPKFKSPLLQRMIGSKERSASKALEEVRKSDSTTSSSSSSPVPAKEEKDENDEQSMPAQLNSDIAELNQVSLEINSDSVAQDSVHTLNGVNHAEDLNEVSTSICDVNQKKEDISELWKNSVGDVQAAF